MESENQEWFNDLPFHQKVDALDCKVIVGPYDQCVCHLWKEKVRELSEREEKVAGLR
jgi:hypothetical protein